MEDKKPDYYVENRWKKEYPTELGSFNFSPINTSAFMVDSTSKVKKYYNSKLKEIENEYNSIVSEIIINERLYSAKCTIDLTPGDSYHLYKKPDGSEFISILSPDDWSIFEHIGEFEFLTDRRWKIKKAP